MVCGVCRGGTPVEGDMIMVWFEHGISLSAHTVIPDTKVGALSYPSCINIHINMGDLHGNLPH